MTGTERKVFQKYYPPDFDPSKIPKGKAGRNRQFVQRVMSPFNMQCNTCHEYIYKGKKFNMRRETAEGEFYLGLKIFRFYFRCPNCLAEISFKTDLENCDYQEENGATRLFEAFKLMQDKERQEQEKEERDQKDPMKMLEKRTKMSRAEMEALGKLEELREKSRQHARINVDEIIENQTAESLAERLRRQEEEDEAMVQQLFGKKDVGHQTVKRLEDDGSDEEVDIKPNIGDLNDFGDMAGPSRLNLCADADVSKDLPTSSSTGKVSKRLVSQKELLKQSVVVKKKLKCSEDGHTSTTIQMSLSTDSMTDQSSSQGQATQDPKTSTVNALAGLADYGSDSNSDGD